MDWSSMFYQDWSGIVRTLIVGTLAYGALIVSLRISGKRTLAKLNAFDLIVTVALGSTLATIVLSEDVALAEGVAALLLLIALQYVVAFTSVRSARFARLVRSEPALLVRNGSLCAGAMRRARVTEEELETVLRTNGERRFEAVAAVILESDGSFSVLRAGKGDGDPETLR
jgi:uncharacterized membrane protein YcaP (DUF421 family)